MLSWIFHPYRSLKYGMQKSDTKHEDHENVDHDHQTKARTEPQQDNKTN